MASNTIIKDLDILKNDSSSLISGGKTMLYQYKKYLFLMMVIIENKSLIASVFGRTLAHTNNFFKDIFGIKVTEHFL